VNPRLETSTVKEMYVKKKQGKILGVTFWNLTPGKKNSLCKGCIHVWECPATPTPPRWRGGEPEESFTLRLPEKRKTGQKRALVKKAEYQKMCNRGNRGEGGARDATERDPPEEGKGGR